MWCLSTDSTTTEHSPWFVICRTGNMVSRVMGRDLNVSLLPRGVIHSTVIARNLNPTTDRPRWFARLDNPLLTTH